MDTAAEKTLETNGERTLNAFERGVAAATVVAVLGVWFIAANLTPDPRGFGTHEQLGLASCRMITIFGIPCAFCGMTTAFVHLAHGDPVQAFVTQPAAVFIALLTIPAAFIALLAAVQGLLPTAAVEFVAARHLFKAAVLILLAAWIYKVIAST